MSITTDAAQPSPAPPRKRRWLRRIMYAFLILPVILGVAAVGLHIYNRQKAANQLEQAIAETDQLDPQWRLEDFETRGKALPDDQNAAIPIMAASALIPESWFSGAQLVEFDDNGAPQFQFQPQRLEELRKQVNPLLPAVELVRKARPLKTGYYQLTWAADMVSTEFPNVIRGRKLADLLHYQAVLQSHDGKHDEAWRTTALVPAIGHSFGEQPGTAQIVRLFNWGMVVADLERCLAQGVVSDELLAQAPQLLGEDAAYSPFYHFFRGERAFMDRLFSKLEAGELAGFPPDDASSAYKTYHFLGGNTYKAHHAWFLRHTNKVVEAGKLKPHEVLAATETLKWQPFLEGPLLTKYLTADCRKVAQSQVYVLALLECAKTGIAVERFRLLHQRWPQSLDELVPAKLIDSIPIDPCDGKPLRYRKTLDGIVVYSIGARGSYEGDALDFHKQPTLTTPDRWEFRLWSEPYRRQPPKNSEITDAIENRPEPKIIVPPYIQPGDGRFLTGEDIKVLCWWTDQTPGDFVVQFQDPIGRTRETRPLRTKLDFAEFKPAEDKKKDPPKLEKVPLPKETEQHYYRYTAYLDELPLNSTIQYTVWLGGKVIRAGSFKTRATPDQSVRAVLVGDLAYGMTKEKEIAYQISKQKPDFFVALGDICYPEGRLNQYMNHFFGTYNNAAKADPKVGAPLMVSVPFYAVVGTHDVDRAKLPTVPDAFGAYYVFSPPKGGPGEGPWVTQLGEDKAAAAKFRTVNADSYPYLSDYSFDWGAAHFTIINANKFLDLDAPAFRKWLLDDLQSTKAKWKIVCFHMPAFHSTVNHYMEQQARLLQPIFEKGGVDITFAGHVHNYQRTVPLKFVPQGTRDDKGKVNGTFTLDKTFDGVKNSKPVGVIHVVSGGGGARLYGPGLEETAPKLKQDHGDNYADYTAKLIADEHTFTVLDITQNQLRLRAMGVEGNELDRIVITKN